MKDRIVAALLRIYSRSWRREYGPELEDILAKEALKPRTVCNVAWNAAWQRIRATEPWLLIGSALALYALGYFAWLIVAPPPYAPKHDLILSLKEGIPWYLTILTILLVMSCGFFTVLRSGGTLPHAGVQTMKMILLANAVQLTVSILMLTGVLGVVLIGPGDTPTTIFEHGFAIGWHNATGEPPNAWLMLLLRIPTILESWLWGAVGGAIGRLFAHKAQPAV